MRFSYLAQTCKRIHKEDSFLVLDAQSTYHERGYHATHKKEARNVVYLDLASNAVHIRPTDKQLSRRNCKLY
jgi:hypothetical protein